MVPLFPSLQWRKFRIRPPENRGNYPGLCKEGQVQIRFSVNLYLNTSLLCPSGGFRYGNHHTNLALLDNYALYGFYRDRKTFISTDVLGIAPSLGAAGSMGTYDLIVNIRKINDMNTVAFIPARKGARGCQGRIKQSSLVSLLFMVHWAGGSN